MGYRTYLYAVNESDFETINNIFNDMRHVTDMLLFDEMWRKIPVEGDCCLGKLIAYSDYDEVQTMKSVNWLEEHLTNPEDLEYLNQYKELTWCGEYMTFCQIFNRNEILDFAKCFETDRSAIMGVPYNLKAEEVWIHLHDYFLIEWIGG